MIDTKTISTELLSYRSEDLHTHIKEMKPGTEIIQILPTSPISMEERTGLYFRDYLLVYKVKKI